MALFLRILEWSDDSKNTLVYKLPLKKGGNEINHKSKLIVRESQTAVFVYKVQVCDVFTPGTYELNTDIFPIISKLAGWKYGFESPIKVDVYFINTKQFTANKWGTSNPILMRDPEFGAIRIKGFGSYAFKVDNASIFLKELFGTNSSFQTQDITDWLKTMLLSALADALAESNISALDLASNTLEFNQTVKESIQHKFQEIGLLLTNLFIENMSVPEEVEKAIDERSKLGILGDKTDVMIKIAAAESMRSASKNQGTGGAFMGAGVGIGAGVGVGSIFADAFKGATEKQAQPQKATKICPTCKATVSATAKFCEECGSKIPQKKFCAQCGSELSPDAKFCPECGNKA